jgi:hypothetical protein
MTANVCGFAFGFALRKTDDKGGVITSADNLVET